MNNVKGLFFGVRRCGINVTKFFMIFSVVLKNTDCFCFDQRSKNHANNEDKLLTEISN